MQTPSVAATAAIAENSTTPTEQQYLDRAIDLLVSLLSERQQSGIRMGATLGKSIIVDGQPQDIRAALELFVYSLHLGEPLPELTGRAPDTTFAPGVTNRIATPVTAAQMSHWQTLMNATRAGVRVDLGSRARPTGTEPVDRLDTAPIPANRLPMIVPVVQVKPKKKRSDYKMRRTLSAREQLLYLRCYDSQKKTTHPKGYFWMSTDNTASYLGWTASDVCHVMGRLVKRGYLSYVLDDRGKRMNHPGTRCKYLVVVGYHTPPRQIGHCTNAALVQNTMPKLVQCTNRFLRESTLHRDTLQSSSSTAHDDDIDTQGQGTPQKQGQVIKAGVSEHPLTASPAQPPAVAMPRTTPIPQDAPHLAHQIAGMLKQGKIATDDAQAMRMATQGIKVQEKRQWRDRDGNRIVYPIPATVGMIKKAPAFFDEPDPKDRLRGEYSVLASTNVPPPPTTIPPITPEIQAIIDAAKKNLRSYSTHMDGTPKDYSGKGGLI